MKPRRHGTVDEYQLGRYFMYVTDWQEGAGERRHREIEIYCNESDIIWNSTDPNQFEEAKRLFFENPSRFNDVPFAGALPSDERKDNGQEEKENETGTVR